jgi:hypothetical protein
VVDTAVLAPCRWLLRLGRSSDYWSLPAPMVERDSATASLCTFLPSLWCGRVGGVHALQTQYLVLGTTALTSGDPGFAP